MRAANVKDDIGWWGLARDIIAAVVGIIVILGVPGALIMWYTGGFKPQSAIAQERLSDKVDSVLAKVDKIEKRFDEIPTPKEFDAENARISNLAHELSTTQSAFIDRFTTDELQAAALSGRIGILSTRVDNLTAGTNQEVRQPRLRGN